MFVTANTLAVFVHSLVAICVLSKYPYTVTHTQTHAHTQSLTHWVTVTEFFTKDLKQILFYMKS